MTIEEGIKEKVDDLQQQLAQLDLILSLSDRLGDDRRLDFLVVKRQNIKVKMYQEIGHQLPHIHIDYGKEHHAASYSIQTSERIEGDLNRAYDGEVKDWVDKNREKLLELWAQVQAGKDVTQLVCELDGSL